jgi:hypothetical protein
LAVPAGFYSGPKAVRVQGGRIRQPTACFAEKCPREGV